MHNLPLEKSEILRYLGYKRQHILTDEVSALVDELMIEVQEKSHARYLYQVYDFTLLEAKQAILLTGTDLILQSQMLYRHLKKAKQVVLLAATLGLEIERQIKLYELSNMTKALILDSACATYIETICDLAEIEIETNFPTYTLNRRFSPGYGDLSLAIQPQFLKTLAADRKLGLSLTETNLMIPRKSITAIIGLFDDKKLALPHRKIPENLTLAMAEIGGFNCER